MLNTSTWHRGREVTRRTDGPPRALPGQGKSGHTYVALIAVVRGLVLDPALVSDFLPCPHQALPLHLAVLHRLQEAEPGEEPGGGVEVRLPAEEDGAGLEQR